MRVEKTRVNAAFTYVNMTWSPRRNAETGWNLLYVSVSLHRR